MNRPNEGEQATTRRAFLKSTALAAGGLAAGLAGGYATATARAALASTRAAAATADFSFVQISDTHIGYKQAANRDVLGTFQEAVARINALPQRPAFVIHTGDHAHLSKASELDTVKQILSTIKVDRVFDIPGEHDVFVDQGKLYLHYFGQGTKGRGWTSFDVNGMHFIALVNDAGAVGKGLGVLGADQLDFIKKDLAPLSSDTPLVLFSHVPLLAVYPQWGWATQDSPQLLALVKRFSSVTALNGHIHQIISRRLGNVVMRTARATSYPDHAPGQVAPSALVVPAAELPRRIGIRLVGVHAGSPMLDLQDRSLAGS
jgi:3',5'-cyclic AMP phosphodiesterase CpdA